MESQCDRRAKELGQSGSMLDAASPRSHAAPKTHLSPQEINRPSRAGGLADGSAEAGLVSTLRAPPERSSVSRLVVVVGLVRGRHHTPQPHHHRHAAASPTRASTTHVWESHVLSPRFESARFPSLTIMRLVAGLLLALTITPPSCGMSPPFIYSSPLSRIPWSRPHRPRLSGPARHHRIRNGSTSCRTLLQR
jgi:hypothetical protein